MRKHTSELDVRHPTGAERILAERARHLTVEGYDADHDRGRARDLMNAAEAYVEVALCGPDAWHDPDGNYLPPGGWPWSNDEWKPTGSPSRDLVKAGSLIAAAIDALEDSRQAPRVGKADIRGRHAAIAVTPSSDRATQHIYPGSDYA
jgi:hypothetical protein